MFQLELAVGLLTYNLICALMVKAVWQAGRSPWQLSFSRCWRRHWEALTMDLLLWVVTVEEDVQYLLQQLARCTLLRQPDKVVHEPRQVRSRWSSYPALRGDRNVARAKVLAEMSETSIS
ncbi:MAG: hypothetical protein N2559_04525 [Anaerolineae bacterium]|nr:hypothetical protein [Anaerolineae bacterium]